MIEVKYVRLLRKDDGSYNIQWSSDNKVWHDEVHEKCFVPIDAKALSKRLYPDAEFVGTYPRRKIPFGH